MSLEHSDPSKKIIRKHVNMQEGDVIANGPQEQDSSG